MFVKHKYIWVMLLLTAIALWSLSCGDSLIMFIARQSIKQADVAQAFEYYQRLETFFRQVVEFQSAVLQSGNLYSKTSFRTSDFRFTGYNDRVISQNIMAPNNDQDMIAALDILQELAQTELDKNNRWIKVSSLVFIKTYYELGKGIKH